MYIAPSKVFAHLDRVRAWSSRHRPAPVTLEWDLTERCYLGCQSCHFAYTHQKGPWVTRDRRLPMAWEGVGDLADTALVHRALGQVAAAGVQSVVWSGGGEPTLHPDWVEILARAQLLGLQQGMYTAGGLFTSETARLAAQALAWVVISLDCVDAETYEQEKGLNGWEAACFGARALAETGQTVVGISFLLHKTNWKQAPMMLDLGRRLGATYVAFRPTIETAADAPARRAPDQDLAWIDNAISTLGPLVTESDVECDLSRFYAYRNWQRGYTTCYGIRLNATITADGRVWVCPNRRGMPESCLGDLCTEGFETLWARHPGQWTEFTSCRIMCRLHMLNEQLAPVFAEYPHAAFL